MTLQYETTMIPTKEEAKGCKTSLTTGDEIRHPGQSQIGGCTCKIPLDISVFRLFPARKYKKVYFETLWHNNISEEKRREHKLCKQNIYVV